ncbi:MAG: SAM-dependent methyltransferase [Pirellula sp.]|nr:SAM-dependent methyltransferase [Pirellula sp.]
MIEPYKGKIYDPCCGSGGMFVQSLKFVTAKALDDIGGKIDFNSAPRLKTEKANKHFTHPHPRHSPSQTHLRRTANPGRRETR